MTAPVTTSSFDPDPYATAPVEFDVIDSRVAETYSLPILNAMGDWYSFAVVEWVSSNRYSVVSGFTDTWQVREYLETRPNAIGVRVYFRESGVWFGQVFVPDSGREWPDFYECQRFARRARHLLGMGLSVPGTVDP